MTRFRRFFDDVGNPSELWPMINGKLIEIDEKVFWNNWSQIAWIIWNGGKTYTEYTDEYDF